MIQKIGVILSKNYSETRSLIFENQSKQIVGFTSELLVQYWYK